MKLFPAFTYGSILSTQSLLEVKHRRECWEDIWLEELDFLVSQSPPRKSFIHFLISCASNPYSFEAFDFQSTCKHITFLFELFSLPLHTLTPFYSCRLWASLFLTSRARPPSKQGPARRSLIYHFTQTYPVYCAAALRLVASQLIKPLAVWHPVPSSARVTLLNEIK